jgi:hypothetical protein
VAVRGLPACGQASLSLLGKMTSCDMGEIRVLGRVACDSVAGREAGVAVVRSSVGNAGRVA